MEASKGQQKGKGKKCFNGAAPIQERNGSNNPLRFLLPLHEASMEPLPFRSGMSSRRTLVKSPTSEAVCERCLGTEVAHLSRLNPASKLQTVFSFLFKDLGPLRAPPGFRAPRNRSPKDPFTSVHLPHLYSPMSMFFAFADEFFRATKSSRAERPSGHLHHGSPRGPLFITTSDPRSPGSGLMIGVAAGSSSPRFVPGGPHQIRTRRFPPSGSSVNSASRTAPYLFAYSRSWWRKCPHYLLESCPAYMASLASSTQPPAPALLHLVHQYRQTS